MTNIEPVIIETRLELIGRYLDHLKKSEGISLDDYLSSFEQQSGETHLNYLDRILY